MDGWAASEWGIRVFKVFGEAVTAVFDLGVGI